MTPEAVFVVSFFLGGVVLSALWLVFGADES